ncbi:MAG: transposase [Alphaproteobacteria bacterium]|nr:transposase [Alphaproteobacteria bacterium]
MARLARIVVPGLAHHVTQRGNRREPIFFEPGDQEVYRDLLAEQALKARIAVWAYCLMPNHVHLVVVPHDVEGLGRAIGETHRRYTNFINARGRWTGHLFQSRFASVAMDEAHLIAAVRYVSLSPVRARFVAQPEDWAWSSARAHLRGVGDGLVVVEPMTDRLGAVGIAELLRPSAEDGAAFAALRSAETTGRPLGNADFIAGLERLLGRPIARRAAGRKPVDPGTLQPNLL